MNKLFHHLGCRYYCFVIFMACMVGVSHAAPRVAENTLTAIDTIALPNDGISVDFTLKKALPHSPNSFMIKGVMPKLVLDLPGVKNALQKKYQSLDVGALRKIQTVDTPQRTRVVLSLKYPVTYQLKQRGNHIVLTMNTKQRITTSPRRTFSSVKRVAKKQPSQHKISNIDFRRDKDSAGRIIVHLSDPHANVNVERQGKQVIAKFTNTSLPTRLMKKLDVTDFGTPVQTIVPQRSARGTQLAITVHGEYDQLAYQVNKNFIIDVKPKAVKNTRDSVLQPNYGGKRISLNFQDIEVRAVLQLLADFTGLNIVVSDSVKGSITLRLNNVPWDQALDIILKTRGLDKRRVGSVMLVAPASEIAAREKQELKAHQQVKELEPLQSELVQINYAKATSIAALLKNKDSNLLTARGNVSTDDRTNTLWIQETSSKLAEIRRIIQRLDIPVRQVLIEARVVNVDRGLDRELGVRFGLSKPGDRISGSLEGANEFGKSPSTDPADISPLSNRLNFDVAADSLSAMAPGRIGIALARLGRGILLDLELSALEEENKGKVISSPRLLTANQQTALIESGEEIPYQQITSSGATSVAFKKAVLSLEVTPQITPDNKIILHLSVNQDKRSSNPAVLNVPAIATRHIETQVLVDNGETVVLGGIFERDKSNNIVRIPFFGELPFIGALFRKKSDKDEQKELLIFVTPRIMSQEALG